MRRAEQSLTPAEREQIARRMESSRDARRRTNSTSSDSRGEGPSNTLAKGKAVDARNWGAVDIPDSELNPEAQQRELRMYSTERSLHSNILDGYDSDEQRQMLEFWRMGKGHQPVVNQSAPPSPEPASHATEAREAAPFVLDPFTWASRVEQLSRELESLKARTAATSSNVPAEPALKKKRSERRKSRASRKELTRKPDVLGLPLAPKSTAGGTGKQRQSSLRPVAQLEPGSYLGRAFQDLVSGGDPGNSDSSSSSSSSGDSSSPTGHGAARADSSTSGDWGSSSDSSTAIARKKSHKKLRLKPEKPEPYDGRPDAQVFHKFMRQMVEYLTAFDVEPTMLASHVSNFLKGNAYNFWVTTVE